MNRSPNSLGASIRTENADYSAINIIGYDGKNYITESNLLSFMRDNKLENMDVVISNIHEFYNIESLSIIDESSTGPNFIFINEVMTLLEVLDPVEISNMAAGKTTGALKRFIDQAAALILKRKYDKISELEKDLEHCDRLIQDIEEEKKVAYDNKNNDSYKFKAMYIYNLAKSIFSIFIAPKLITKTYNWKGFKGFQKFVNGKKISPFLKLAGGDVQKAEAFKKAAFGAGDILASGMIGDARNLYLSFADYSKLLDEYEYKLRNIRNNLEFQLREAKRAESKKESQMIDLKEDFTGYEVADVHYMSPEDLKVKENEPKTIMHDDVSMEVPKPQADAPSMAAEGPEPVEDIIPREEEPEKEPSEEPVVSPDKGEEEIKPYIPDEKFTPVNAIDQARSNPSNVLVTKYDDHYYIANNDLKQYMGASKNDDYDKALDDIIKANDDPDLKPENIKVVMSNSELSDCSEAEVAAMEAASVEFEIY